jgi:hypothetical protein
VLTKRRLRLQSHIELEKKSAEPVGAQDETNLGVYSTHVVDMQQYALRSLSNEFWVKAQPEQPHACQVSRREIPAYWLPMGTKPGYTIIADALEQLGPQRRSSNA